MKIVKGEGMKYTCEITINKDIDDVVKTYIDYKQMHLWQPGLKDVRHQGKKHQKASVSYLIYEFDQKEMTMKKTIEEYKYPNLFIAIYQVPGVWNRCVNHFRQTKDGTHWTMETEFVFEDKADHSISTFKNKTLTGMELFKTYIENK
jgi:hypothetical protein